MSLQKILEATRGEAVRHASRGATYATALARHASLAPFPEPKALLAALDLDSPLADGERRAVLSALLTEAQESPHPLWQSLLLVAFSPMLRRLRSRIGNPGSEELDQQVLFAFLGALQKVAPGPFIALALRWGTEKALFAPLRKERQAPEILPFNEEEHATDLHEVEAIDKAALAEVARFVESQCDQELMHLFLATTAGDVKLKDYVARTYRGRTKRGLAAEYDRLCRARLRLASDLRAHFRGRAAA